MSIQKWIRGGIAAALIGAAGCVPAAVYVDTEPPPPRAEIVTVAPFPGAIWIGGHWRWNGRAYFWTPGHWQARRVGWIWVPHHWERRGPRWQFVPGGWRRG